MQPPHNTHMCLCMHMLVHTVRLAIVIRAVLESRGSLSVDKPHSCCLAWSQKLFQLFFLLLSFFFQSPKGQLHPITSTIVPKVTHLSSSPTLSIHEGRRQLTTPKHPSTLRPGREHHGPSSACSQLWPTTYDGPAKYSWVPDEGCQESMWKSANGRVWPMEDPRESSLSRWDWS